MYNANSEGPEQTVQMHSLLRTVAVSQQVAWVLPIDFLRNNSFSLDGGSSLNC